MTNIEVELRALISEEKYQELKRHFETMSVGKDDEAQTYTFLTSTLNIKIKNLTTQKKAKITVKKGAEYEQHVDEIELPIQPDDVEKAVGMITALGFEKHIPSLQKRIDYNINGIKVSLKHETNWKYHIEAEIIVNAVNEIPKATKKLQKFFKDHGLTPMTEEETRKLINSIIVKYGLEPI